MMHALRPVKTQIHSSCYIVSFFLYLGRLLEQYSDVKVLTDWNVFKWRRGYCHPPRIGI